MTSLYSWRDGVVLSVLMAVGGYSLAVGRSYFDTLVPEAIQAGAPRQLARELVGRELMTLSEDDRLRVYQFLTSLLGEGVGAHAEDRAMYTLWLRPCVRGRTHWLLAQCGHGPQVRLHQFDSDWQLVAETYVERSTHFTWWTVSSVELVSQPLSPIVVVTAEVDFAVTSRACFGLDDGGAFLLRYEDEGGHYGLSDLRLSWATTWNDRPEFTPASWLQALSSPDPELVLSALNRYPRAWSDDAELVKAWQDVAVSPRVRSRLKDLLDSPCAWIRDAAAALREHLK